MDPHIEPRESLPNIPPPPNLENVEALLKQGEEDLFDVHRLMDRTRASLPPESTDALARLDALMGDANAAYDELKLDLSPPALEGAPSGFTFPTIAEDDSGIIDLSGAGKKERWPAKLNTETFAQELSQDRGAALERMQEALDGLFTGGCAFDDLDIALANANDPEIRSALLKTLAPRLGASVTERLMNDPTFREELRQIQLDLAEPLKKGAPSLLANASLEKLVGAKELFGSHAREMAAAFDLSSYDERLRLSSSSMSITYKMGPGGFPQIDATMHSYVDRKGEGSVGEVKRIFSVETVETSRGLETIKSVDHSHFKLDTRYQGEGMAAKMLGKSLETYDKMGVQEINTMANIDMGGYVWQSYGFGWNPRASLGYDPEQSASWNERALATSVSHRIDSAKQNAVARLKEMGLVNEKGETSDPGIQAALAEFDRLSKNPLAVTPQDLGRVGKGEDAPMFYRQKTGSGFATEETWMTAEQFAEARSNGAIPEEEAAKIERNSFHMGKLGMASSDFVWYGSIDLRSGSPTRHLFEQKLKRASAE